MLIYLSIIYMLFYYLVSNALNEYIAFKCAVWAVFYSSFCSSSSPAAASAAHISWRRASGGDSPQRRHWRPGAEPSGSHPPPGAGQEEVNPKLNQKFVDNYQTTSPRNISRLLKHTSSYNILNIYLIKAAGNLHTCWLWTVSVDDPGDFAFYGE